MRLPEQNTLQGVRLDLAFEGRLQRPPTSFLLELIVVVAAIEIQAWHDLPCHPACWTSVVQVTRVSADFPAYLGDRPFRAKEVMYPVALVLVNLGSRLVERPCLAKTAYNVHLQKFVRMDVEDATVRLHGKGISLREEGIALIGLETGLIAIDDPAVTGGFFAAAIDVLISYRRRFRRRAVLGVLTYKELANKALVDLVVAHFEDGEAVFPKIWFGCYDLNAVYSARKSDAVLERDCGIMSEVWRSGGTIESLLCR